MKNKLILLFFLAILIHSIFFVSAEIKSYCFSEVDIGLEAGWNYIIPPNYKNFDMGILPDSDIKKEDIVFITYPLQGGKEVVVYSSDPLVSASSSSLLSDFDLKIAPAFVKAKRSGNIKYLVPEIPKLFSNNPFYTEYNIIPFYFEWNGLVMTPELKGKKLKEFTGTCKITDVKVWKGQEWRVYNYETMVSGYLNPSRGLKFSDFEIPSNNEDVGHGIVFKVNPGCDLSSRRNFWGIDW